MQNMFESDFDNVIFFFERCNCAVFIAGTHSHVLCYKDVMNVLLHSCFEAMRPISKSTCKWRRLPQNEKNGHHFFD